MTRVLSLLIVALALLAAGCGGSTTAATGEPSGAEITPASAVGFVSLNTDAGSEQWQQAIELLQKLPAREKLLGRITGALADEDLDFARDIRPALGPTVDFAVLSRANGQTDVVGMTQPADGAKLEALLRKGGKPAVHAEIDGWTVFAEDEAALAPFRVDGDKLQDSEPFSDAMAELPDEANAKAYFDGRAVPRALGRTAPGLGTVPVGDFDWVSAAVSSEQDGFKIEGAAKGRAGESKPFDRSLLEQIPSGALVAIAFNGGNTSALDQLRANPKLSRQSARLEELLGIGLQDLVGLLGGDAVLYVRPGSPDLEVTLLTKPENPKGLLRTIDRAVTRVSLFSGRPAPTRRRIGDVVVREVSLDRVSLYYGVRDGALIASTATAAFGDYSGASLEDDPVFTDAAAAAKLPDDAAALLFVNVEDSLPVLQDLAREYAASIPPDVAANLEPLESFLGFSMPDSDIARFSGLLKIP